MRRVVAAAIASLLVMGAVLLVPAAANAKTKRPVVGVIQISGLLDRVQADFWQHSLKDLDAEHAAALVVQLDSNRSVLSSEHFRELLNAIKNAATPVGIWVGPARSGAVGGNVEKLLLVADVVGLAPGASIDKRTGIDIDVDVKSPTLGDFLVDLDGRAGISIPTKIIRTTKTPHREPEVDVRFAKPTLTARTIHGVSAPGPAYAMFVIGLLLAVLEFSSAGFGLAAATSAILLVLACIGLGGLPVSGPAVGALVFAVFGFSIDLQAGAPRFWTAVGAGAMVFGSFSLFHDGMSVPLLWILAVFGLTAAFVFTGMPSLIRARFSSPTIGREGFVGELGAAVGVLHPEGFVSVRGATWRARTNRATPIEDGSVIRVIGLDGLVLDVEPEEGGAKDHRERSKATK